MKEVRAKDEAGTGELLASSKRNAGRAWYKRPMDLGILVVAHVALAPVWLALWTLIPLMIWLQDRGPVFYAQLRAGRGEKRSGFASSVPW